MDGAGQSTERGEAEGRDQETFGIQLSWLVKLRWGFIAGQILTIAVVVLGLGIQLPVAPLAAILAVGCASNVGVALWMRKARRVGQFAVGLLMAADVLLFTGLLYWTGGPLNPFNFLYIVYIALAAVVLRTVWTWGLVALSSACFGVLFLEPRASGGMPAHMHGLHAMHGGAGGESVAMHLQGMWVAFGVAAAFIVYFVSRVTRDLAQREQELARARARAARAEKLGSLATLAAGAAHELATPLSTIAVVVKELERDLAAGRPPGDLSGDARLIREEVDRCREILFRMAADAGQGPGDGVAVVSVGELIDGVLSRVRNRAQVQLVLEPSIAACHLRIPRRAVDQALLGVLKNAEQASSAGSAVELSAHVRAPFVRIQVRDRGRGMPAEVLSRAGEPFYTTKPPGQGMGLGLFVARTVLERLGGTLELTSEEQRGTTAVMTIPLHGSIST